MTRSTRLITGCLGRATRNVFANNKRLTEIVPTPGTVACRRSGIRISSSNRSGFKGSTNVPPKSRYTPHRFTLSPWDAAQLPPEPLVENRNDDHVEGGRTEQPEHDDHRHRSLNLAARLSGR